MTYSSTVQSFLESSSHCSIGMNRQTKWRWWSCSFNLPMGNSFGSRKALAIPISPGPIVNLILARSNQDLEISRFPIPNNKERRRKFRFAIHCLNHRSTLLPSLSLK